MIGDRPDPVVRVRSSPALLVVGPVTGSAFVEGDGLDLGGLLRGSLTGPVIDRVYALLTQLTCVLGPLPAET
jgi:hypothetical protein